MKRALGALREAMKMKLQEEKKKKKKRALAGGASASSSGASSCGPVPKRSRGGDVQQ